MECGFFPRRFFGVVAAAALFLGLAALAGAGTARRFELAPGPAEVALNEFAVQTGLQVLFPTELTAGVETNTVRGHYSIREALDRMLSDTGLAAKYNEQTGVIEIARAEVRREKVVRLPPYMVEGDDTLWRYARVGNMELLSSCIDDVTNRVIQQLFRLQEAMDQIIAPDLLFKSTNPPVYVLHTDADQASVPQELIGKLRQHEGKGGGGTGMTWDIGIMSSYGFWDVDSRGIYFILNEGGFMLGRLSIRGDYLRELLVRRAPELPPWFVEGTLELYQTVTLDPYGLESVSIGRANQHRLPGGVARFAPFVWISPEETQGVRKQGAPGLLPMERLLATPPAAALPEHRLWKAQAALFVRWALDESKGGRQALWELARLADKKQPDETDFQRCFGLDYHQAGEALRRYLPKAIRREFSLKPQHFADLPDYTLRSATEMDVALVKGELDRLKIDYVRRFSPRLTAHYIAQARSTLRRGLGLENHQARLSGLLGLCECDAGDDLAARSWLEEAVARGTTQARVYYELARIRWQAAQVAEGIRAAGQRREIWELLLAATRYRPQLAEAYDLMAEILATAPADSADRRVDELAQGLVYFPRQTDLIKAVTAAYWRNDRPEEARAVLARGLMMSGDAVARADLAAYAGRLGLVAGNRGQAGSE